MKLSYTNNNCSATKLSRQRSAQQTVNVIVHARRLGSTVMAEPQSPIVPDAFNVTRIYAWLDWSGVLEYFGENYNVSLVVIQGIETRWVKEVKLYKIVVAVF